MGNLYKKEALSVGMKAIFDYGKSRYAFGLIDSISDKRICISWEDEDTPYYLSFDEKTEIRTNSIDFVQ